MNDSLPLLFAVSTLGNRENLNLKRFPKENLLSPKGCKEGNSLGTRAKEQASIGWIPRYIASVFLVSPLRFDFRRLPGPVLIRLPGPVLSAGSFSRTAAGNRAYPWPFRPLCWYWCWQVCLTFQYTIERAWAEEKQMSRAFAGRDFDMSMIIITYHSLENYNLKLLSSLSSLQITHKHI